MNKQIIFLLSLISLSLYGQQAKPLDIKTAQATLSTKPPRNPVKSSSPIVKRTYERRAEKGIEVEVVHREDGTSEEHPFVSLPILFVRSTDRLFDTTSEANVWQMAAILAGLIERENAVFAVQGHTSVEGAAEANQTLSERRAGRVHELLAAQGVPATALKVIGLGETCARHSEEAPEIERQQDRRVLIVRMK